MTTGWKSKFATARLRRGLLEATRAGWRAGRGAAKEDFGMVASSIAFSSFLSLLPLLALVALAYGTFTDPHEVVADIRRLMGVIPAEARGIINAWLGEALLQRTGRGARFAVSVVLLTYSASRAGRSLLYGLNVACRVDRRRGFLARRVTSILIVLIAAMLVTGVLLAISIFSFVARFLPGLPFASEVARVLFWALTAISGVAGLTTIYKFGPARTAPPWREVAPGAVLATVLWLAVTALFSNYLAEFGNFGKVYGSFGAVVLLQFWLLGSALAFLLGARFNLELAGDPAGDESL